MRHFEINRYEYHSNKVGKAWDGTKFIVLSDLHDNSYRIDLERLYQTIILEHPDYILIAGDMYNGEPGYPNDVATKFLERIADKFEIYYGMGNHEYRMMLEPQKYPKGYEKFESMIRKTGICLLQNESVVLNKDDDAICISSVMIGREFYKKLKREPMKDGYMNELMGTPNHEMLQILLAHHPNYFKQYAEWGADIVLSGHVHGGMARLPIVGGILAPNYRLFPHYDKGRFDEFGSTMFLSAGIGTHTINLRPFNPPEMLVIKIHTAC